MICLVFRYNCLVIKMQDWGCNSVERRISGLVRQPRGTVDSWWTMSFAIAFLIIIWLLPVVVVVIVGIVVNFFTFSSEVSRDQFLPNLIGTMHHWVLFLCFHLSVSRISCSYGEVTITGDLTGARRWRPYWPVRFYSLPCLLWYGTYIMVFSEDPWHSHLLPSV